MWHILRRVARVGLVPTEPVSEPAAAAAARGDLDAELLRLLGRALAVRLVDAGSCNGCEFELNALGNAHYNLEGRGVHFVASPRHADMLLVTGPVSRHMEAALRRTCDATPEPRLVIAVGECGANGGEFGASYASCGAVAEVIRVDAVIRGCPPTPLALMRGILEAIGKRAG